MDRLVAVRFGDTPIAGPLIGEKKGRSNRIVAGGHGVNDMDKVDRADGVDGSSWRVRLEQLRRTAEGLIDVLLASTAHCRCA